MATSPTLSNSYILLNGNFHTQTGTIFNIYNRALQYGDCITETIHTCADRLCFVDRHLKHLRDAMKIAMMNIPEKFFNTNKIFSQEISKLLTRNRTFKGSTLKIKVFRSSIASNPNINDNIEYVIYSHQLESLGYEFNTNGLKLGMLTGTHVAPTIMSGYDTHDNAIIKVIAKKKCIKDKLNDMILVNFDGNIVETAHLGNIFLIQDKILKTPPLSDGCLGDVMRSIILETAAKNGYSVVYDSHITEEDIKKAEEMFVASTEIGIKWVSAYKTCRFMRTKTKQLFEIINNLYLAEQ